MSGGYVKIARGIFKHIIFKDEPFTEREVWIWLICGASYKDDTIRIPNTNIVTKIKRGEYMASYRFFMVPTDKHPPYYLNTRVYSAILIQNTIQHRWRGRYNEDTDLCIRVLKDGYCTILFNAFLQEKAGTMTLKGGNTDELYQDDGRLKMAKSLQEQHPDICTITWKFGRWQHQVNYDVFKKNKLRRKNIEIKQGIDNYDMILTKMSKI